MFIYHYRKREKSGELPSIVVQVTNRESKIVVVILEINTRR
jgi:hypothetical protein